MKLKVKAEKEAMLKKNNKKDTGFDVAIYKIGNFLKDETGKRVFVDMNVHKIDLYPLQRIAVDTGIRAEWDMLHNNIEDDKNILIDTQLRNRSGLASDGVLVQIGTIDEQYRNRVYATIINASNDVITLKKGDRIGQIVIAIALNPEIEFVDEIDENTERGIKGHGSSDERESVE